PTAPPGLHPLSLHDALPICAFLRQLPTSVSRRSHPPGHARHAPPTNDGMLLLTHSLTVWGGAGPGTVRVWRHPRQAGSGGQVGGRSGQDRAAAAEPPASVMTDDPPAPVRRPPALPLSSPPRGALPGPAARCRRTPGGSRPARGSWGSAPQGGVCRL